MSDRSLVRVISIGGERPRVGSDDVQRRGPAVAASGEHVKALVRSHAAGDDATFYAVALQVAAKAARQGHNVLAGQLKQAVDAARSQPVVGTVTSIARPRGDLADLVTASFPDVRLADLVVSAPLKDAVCRVLHEQRQRKVLIDHGFPPVHRLLLEGPPGTGKTMTAAVIAHELSLPLLTVRLDSLLSKYLGETASRLRAVFDAAASQRAVYLFDEFDALGARRDGNDVGEARRILNAFLVFLEEASSESIIVAATNHRAILDRALFRRFDLALTYGLPDAKQAVQVIRTRLGPLGSRIPWAELTEQTVDLSHADLVKAAENAAKNAILRGGNRVTAADLNTALAARRAVSGE